MKAKREILLIEDDLGFASAVETWLRSKLPQSSIVITHVRTMEEGIAKAPFAHAILLDLTLSDQWTSEETPKIIKEKLRPYAPVIIVSGKVFEGHPSEVEWINDLIAVYGADDFVSKNAPDFMDQICRKITSAVGRRIFAASEAANARKAT